MKKQVFSLLALLGIATFSHLTTAQSSGDPQAGEQLTAVCASCHGPDGNSEVTANPKLAGQNANYTFKQLMDIKNGAREVPQMSGMLSNLDEQDLRDIAAYYAEQEVTMKAVDPELLELGEQIYRDGIDGLEVAACSACHSPTGQGNAPAGYPMLSGQHPEYIAAQMRAFQAGERTNDGTGSPMQVVSERLTDREIEAVASYVSGLSAGSSQASQEGEE